MPEAEQIRDEDKFKIFAEMISNSKTNPTASEIAVQQTPFLDKDGSFFNTALAVVDRALYKPPKSDVENVLQNIAVGEEFSTAKPQDNKAYTRYQFLNTTINSVEDFFEDVSYDVNVGNVNISKNLKSHLKIGANVDILGNFSLNASKKYGAMQFGAAAQYKPVQKEGRINLNFANGDMGASTNIYINGRNPGFMTNYTRYLENNTSIGAGISIFKENTNAYVKYKHDNLSVSAYGSLIRSPYVGISAVINY